MRQGAGMKVPHFIGRMKQNNAVVLKTVQKGVYVSVNASCTVNEGCYRCSLCKNDEKKLTFFCPVPNPEQFSKDNCIQIRYFSLNAVFASGIVFGIPVVCPIVAYAAWASLFKTDTESPGAVLASIAALAAGFMIIYIFEKLINFIFPVTIETVSKKHE